MKLQRIGVAVVSLFLVALSAGASFAQTCNEVPDWSAPDPCSCRAAWSYNGQTCSGCANPDADPNGPWCFTESACNGNNYAYCSPPPPPPSNTCLDPFPDYVPKTADCTCKNQWSYNGQTCSGCANPDEDTNGPWCFTDGPCNGTNYAYCEAPPDNCANPFPTHVPPGDCTCKGQWSFGGQTFCGACANPDNDANGPWCFTDGVCGGRTWAYCRDADDGSNGDACNDHNPYTIEDTVVDGRCVGTVPTWSPAHPRILEMVVLVDHALHLDKDTEAIAFAHDVVGGIDRIYGEQLSLSIAPPEVIVFSESDPWPPPSGLDRLLDRATNWSAHPGNIAADHDAVMLLTGRDLSGAVSKLAWVGTVCGSSSVSVVEASGRNPRAVALDAAGALANNLGASFDGFGNDCNPVGFLMSPTQADVGPTMSSCTKTAIGDTLQSLESSTSNCLHNFPAVPGGVCGDGVRVASEECDDGNLVAKDGCSPLCAIEPGFNCTGDAPSFCSSCGAVPFPRQAPQGSECATVWTHGGNTFCGICANPDADPAGPWCKTDAGLKVYCEWTECTHDGQPCDDGNRCTTKDFCVDGECVGQDPVTCAPTNCLEEPGVCNPNTGLCSNVTRVWSMERMEAERDAQCSATFAGYQGNWVAGGRNGVPGTCGSGSGCGELTCTNTEWDNYCYTYECPAGYVCTIGDQVLNGPSSVDVCGCTSQPREPRYVGECTPCLTAGGAQGFCSDNVCRSLTEPWPAPTAPVPPPPAFVAIETPIDANKITFKRSRSGKEKTVFAALDPLLAWPAVDSESDPRIAGASLEFFSYNGKATYFPLPASGWTLNRKGTTYKFTNKAAPDGFSPVRRGMIKQTKKGTKVAHVASLLGLPLDEPHVGVGVRFRVGPTEMCARFGTAKKDEGDQFAAFDASASDVGDCSFTTLHGLD